MPKNLQQVNYQKIKSTLFNNLRIKEDLRGITKKKKAKQNKNNEWDKNENTTSNFVGHS